MGSFFVTLLLTKSRSAWLATILSLFAAGFFHPTLRQSGWAFAKRFRHWLAAVAALCIFSVGGILVRDPMIVAEAGKSLSYRFDYWRGAIALIRAEPWTGYGVANFQQNYNRFKVISASESPADPHNFIFETAAAGGLPLLAILFAILSILFLKMLDLSRSQREHAERPFGSSSRARTWTTCVRRSSSRRIIAESTGIHVPSWRSGEFCSSTWPICGACHRP